MLDLAEQKLSASSPAGLMEIERLIKTFTPGPKLSSDETPAFDGFIDL